MPRGSSPSSRACASTCRGRPRSRPRSRRTSAGSGKRTSDGPRPTGIRAGMPTSSFTGPRPVPATRPARRAPPEARPPSQRRKPHRAPRRHPWLHRAAASIEVKLAAAMRKQVGQGRRTQEALRQSEERFRLLVAHALDAVITIDIQGRITSWNPQAERLFGWAQEEVLGRLLSETIIPPTYREAHERGLARFRATGEGPVLGRRIELTALHRNGTEFPVELAITPMRSGKTVLFSAFLRDITEAKRAEEARRQSEASFRLLFTSNPLPMWVYDVATMSFLEVNAAAVAHYGYSREEFLAMRITDIRPPEEVPRLEAILTGFGAEADPAVRRHAGTWTHRLKDGRIREVDIVSHAIDFAGRRAALVVAIDVTELRQTQASLAKSTERLRILHEIDRALIAAEAPVAIAEAVLRRLRDLLGVPRAIVNLFDLATGEVEWLAAAGRRRIRLGPGVRFPLSLMGDVEALRRGEPQVIDVAALPRGPEAEALLASGVHTYMVVPMIAGGELIGGLGFGGGPGEVFPPQIGIPQEGAAHPAIALAHGRLPQRAERQAGGVRPRGAGTTREPETADEQGPRGGRDSTGLGPHAAAGRHAPHRARNRRGGAAPGACVGGPATAPAGAPEFSVERDQVQPGRGQAHRGVRRGRGRPDSDQCEGHGARHRSGLARAPVPAVRPARGGAARRQAPSRDAGAARPRAGATASAGPDSVGPALAGYLGRTGVA